MRDGKQLWPKPLQLEIPYGGEIHLGDLDGDRRPDVVAQVVFSAGLDAEQRIRGFDGRDGKLRWSWTIPGARFSPKASCVTALANFGGNNGQCVCVSYRTSEKGRWIQILDGSGKERAHRYIVDDPSPILIAADLNGDGRDELLVNYGGLVHAWDRDLKDIWMWPSQSGKVDQIVPASAGRPGEVILSPAAGFDAETGQPRWAGLGPLVERPPQFMPRLLDPGDSTRLPLLIGDGLGATVCRVAMPTSSDGSLAPPHGNLVHARHFDDDPRWARPLPWLNWLKDAFSPVAFLVSGGLALADVVLPLLILRLIVGRRRSFNIWALMILPVVAAIPLMLYLTAANWLPVWPALLLTSEKKVFLAASAAGLPIAYCVVLMAASAFRLRYKPVLLLLGLTVVTTLLVAGFWIWRDMKAMASLEHYAWDGWEMVLLPGAYLAAVIWGVGWSVFRLYGWAGRQDARFGVMRWRRGSRTNPEDRVPLSCDGHGV